MASYGSAGTVTGKAFLTKVKNTISTALPMPVVSDIDLKKKTHPINIARFSGKQKGAMVCVETSTDKKLHIAVAAGSEPESPWYVLETDPSTIDPTA